MQVHKKQKTYDCDMCDSSFKGMEELFLHVRDSHPKHFCDMCEKEFLKIESLENHIKFEHLNLTKLQCDMGEKSFQIHPALDDHKKLEHDNKRQIEIKTEKHFDNKEHESASGFEIKVEDEDLYDDNEIHDKGQKIEDEDKHDLDMSEVEHEVQKEDLDKIEDYQLDKKYPLGAEDDIDNVAECADLKNNNL